MKIRIGLFCLALAACTPSGPPDTAGAAAGVPDVARNGSRTGEWLRAESERRGMPIVWEFRRDLTPERRAALPQLLVVSLMNTDDGAVPTLPDAKRLQAFDAIERQLLDRLRGKAELAAVLTYYRQYDWYFYTDDSVDQGALRSLLEQSGQADAAVSAEPDADGRFYSALLERVGEKQ